MLLIMKSASHVFAILNFDPSCCCCYWLQMLTPSDLHPLCRGYSNGGYSYPVLPQYGSYNPYGTVDRRQFAGTLPRDGLYNYDPYRRWPYVSSKGQLDHSPRIFSHFQSKSFHYRLFKMGFWSWLEKRGVSKFQHNWGCQPNLKTLRKFTDSGPAVCPIIALYLLNSDYQGSPWLWGCRGWR